jgi:hypothetical protein
MPSVEEKRTEFEFSSKAVVLPPTSRESRLDLFVRRHVPQVVTVLCTFAALRILLLIAAFPLFNNVDEKNHFLSIRMYANGQIPGKALPLIDDDFSRTYLPYWSPEYDRSPGRMEREGAASPIYPLSPQERESAFDQGFYAWKLDKWEHTPNYEAQGAPLYYIIGAGWYKLGTSLGFRDWGLGYWLRLINPFAYAIFIWIAYKLVQRVYPDRPFLFIGVPALLAIFPNDVFYGMNRDVLSPALCSLILLLMIESVTEERESWRSLLLASLLLGLGFVLEVSNCVFYLALGATLWEWIHRTDSSRRRKVTVGTLSVAVSLTFPLVWMLRNYLVMGDLTGSRAKLQWFGWTVKPLGAMLHHPLFTRSGLIYFSVNLIRDFWQGEIKWFGEPMRWAVADKFYILSTALLLLIFVLDFIRKAKVLPVIQRWTGGQFILLIAAATCFLAGISLPFDYHDFGYPSREHPFFISGRIICGALLPFAVAYLGGMEALLGCFRRWISPLVLLACLLLFVTASEIRVRSAVFRSPYNFFALVHNAHYQRVPPPVAVQTRSDHAR